MRNITETSEVLKLSIKMRSTFFIPTLVAVVAALPAPAPQEINLDLFAQVPTPTVVQATGFPTIVTFDTKALLASATKASSISVAITDAASSTPSIVKRAVCSPQPSGYGPVTNNPKDDAASFLANPVYANAANAAAVPAGYAQTFQNLNASSSAYGYLVISCLLSFSRTNANPPEGFHLSSIVQPSNLRH